MIYLKHTILFKALKGQETRRYAKRHVEPGKKFVPLHSVQKNSSIRAANIIDCWSYRNSRCLSLRENVGHPYLTYVGSSRLHTLCSRCHGAEFTGMSRCASSLAMNIALLQYLATRLPMILFLLTCDDARLWDRHSSVLICVRSREMPPASQPIELAILPVGPPSSYV